VIFDVIVFPLSAFTLFCDLSHKMHEYTIPCTKRPACKNHYVFANSMCAPQVITIQNLSHA